MDTKVTVTTEPSNATIQPFCEFSDGDFLLVLYNGCLGIKVGERIRFLTNRDGSTRRDSMLSIQVEPSKRYIVPATVAITVTR